MSDSFKGRPAGQPSTAIPTHLPWLSPKLSATKRSPIMLPPISAQYMVQVDPVLYMGFFPNRLFPVWRRRYPCPEVFHVRDKVWVGHVNRFCACDYGFFC